MNSSFFFILFYQQFPFTPDGDFWSSLCLHVTRLWFHCKTFRKDEQILTHISVCCSFWETRTLLRGRMEGYRYFYMFEFIINKLPFLYIPADHFLELGIVWKCSIAETKVILELISFLSQKPYFLSTKKSKFCQTSKQAVVQEIKFKKYPIVDFLIKIRNYLKEGKFLVCDSFQTHFGWYQKCI